METQPGKSAALARRLGTSSLVACFIGLALFVLAWTDVLGSIGALAFFSALFCYLAAIVLGAIALVKGGGVWRALVGMLLSALFLAWAIWMLLSEL